MLVKRATNKKRQAIRLVDRGAYWQVQIRIGRYEHGSIQYRWCVEYDKAVQKKLA